MWPVSDFANRPIPAVRGCEGSRSESSWQAPPATQDITRERPGTAHVAEKTGSGKARVCVQREDFRGRITYWLTGLSAAFTVALTTC
jgi:hypothetical protein